MADRLSRIRNLPQIAPASLWRWVGIMALVGASVVLGDDPVLPFAQDKDTWYTKYPHYPEYCSTPKQMKDRAVPPLNDNEGKVGASKLVHATAILRHGARTIREGPSEDNYRCWDGFWEDPQTGVWDCPLTTFVMPPNPRRINEEEYTGSALLFVPRSMFLFEKEYDALEFPQTNVLNGTCQQGQLILEGYEQQVQNGKFLRDAYLYEAGDSTHDFRMRLFAVGEYPRDRPGKKTYPEPWAKETNLYLRSDDTQSTLMSGQLLMRGLFEKELIESRKRNNEYRNYGYEVGNKGNGQVEESPQQAFPSIPVHTADRERDILGGFQEGCDALAKIQAASDDSWEYKRFLESKESREVREFMEDHLNHEAGLLDCLMSTVCTDRPLPDRFGVYNPHPNSMFNRIAAYQVQNQSYHLLFNDAEYSKLSMGPLWAEIMDHIRPVVDDSWETEDHPRAPARLAIYSGYDSTIMEILASLGAWEAKEWPPYASMVLLEIHELLDDSSDKAMFNGKFAFRLIYNGEVLTEKIVGCTKGMDLCDVDHLLQRVQPFAQHDVDCIDVDLGKVYAMEVAHKLITTTGGIVLIILIIIGSALVGSVAVFYHLTGEVPTEELKDIQRRVLKKKKNRTNEILENDEAVDEEFDDHDLQLWAEDD